MREDIKKRIEAVRHGEVPAGYRRTKDIGIAPLDWKAGQLADVLHNEARPVPKPNEPYWRLGIRSWAKGTFHTYVDDPKTVDMDELYVVRENDLVVNITFAWEHAIAVASKEDDGLLVSHRFPTYIFDGGNVPEYYKAVVSRRFFKDMLDHISPGGAGRNRVLNRKDFLALPCYIPPVEEQQKIAEILATCDRVIELKQQLLNEKRRQKQWLMQNLLNPNSSVRLPGFTGLWRKCKLGELGTTYSGLSGKSEGDFGEGVPYIPYINIFSNPIVDEEGFEYVRIGSDEKQSRVQFGDIFFTTSSEIPAEIGMSSVYLGEEQELYLNSFCFGFRLNDFESLIPEYAAYCFRGLALRKIMYKLAQGATRYNLSKNDFMKETIVIPPTIKEQQAIANVLLMADSEIQMIQKELEAWQQKKKALMQLLLTGLVRVNA